MSYSTQSISSWVTLSPIIGPIAANVIHAKFSGKVLPIGVGRVQTVCRPAFAPKSPAILPITRLRASESLTKTFTAPLIWDGIPDLTVSCPRPAGSRPIVLPRLSGSFEFLPSCGEQG
ncbi:hypothetical protein PG995_012213 [Apiospora arundinis]